ncbi:MAG: uroporphyrinogen-III C-methyltransferase [Bacteroidota bacterium]
MKARNNQPKLSLVGAGPGDPDLITLKAIKVLTAADVILYDALANEELLAYAKESALKIFVGKRAGAHSHKQVEINQLIVQYAFSHGHVLRLKGGDPFVFGRGYEELAYAETFGIETEVVPGISSVSGVPALQKIPLTHRGLSRGFWVVTATSATGELADDLHLAAQSNATVVILMGMRKLPQIVEIFSQFGKAETPAAVIQAGSTPDEQIALGQVANILEESRRAQLGAPAIILIGEVVGLHDKMKLYESIEQYIPSI